MPHGKSKMGKLSGELELDVKKLCPTWKFWAGPIAAVLSISVTQTQLWQINGIKLTR